MPMPEQGRAFEVALQRESAERATSTAEAPPDVVSAAAPEASSGAHELPQREHAVSNAAEKDPLTKAIDGILEQHLEQFFDGLTPEQQGKFVVAGEALTAQIAQAVRQNKLNFSRILDDVTDWLHLLPMLNKDFLRQEAWIKTQAIVQYAQQEAGRQEGVE